MRLSIVTTGGIMLKTIHLKVPSYIQLMRSSYEVAEYRRMTNF